MQRQLRSRTLKAGEEELFKAHAREKGSVKIIDLIKARLDAKTDSYLVTLPNLQLRDVRINSKFPHLNYTMRTVSEQIHLSLVRCGLFALEEWMNIPGFIESK